MPFNVIDGVPLLFIHIPKTGGTSIKKYFGFQESGHETMQDFLYHLDEARLLLAMNKEHSENEETVKKWTSTLSTGFGTLVSKARRDKVHPFHYLFKFSFVRNPWDRSTSIYHYHKDDYGGLGTFKDFTEELKTRSGPIFQPEADSVLRLTQTQYLSIGDKHATVVPEKFDESGAYNYRALHPTADANSRIMIDHVGRLETIERDVEHICRTMRGSPARTDVSWMNNRSDFISHERKSLNSRHRYTSMYKDFDAIYAVFDYYYDDITNFGYTFAGYPNCEITKECFKRRGESANVSTITSGTHN